MQDLSGFSVPKGFRAATSIKVQLWWAVQGNNILPVATSIVSLVEVFLITFIGKIGKNVILVLSVKITYPLTNLRPLRVGLLLTSIYITLGA